MSSCGCGCGCSSDQVLFFPCSGGSNVGQIANDVCRQLMMDGQGKMFCLAGIGGRVSSLVEKAKNSPKNIVIDGCNLHCAKKTLEEAGVPITNHIVLTELGVVKNYNLITDQQIIHENKVKILQAILENK
ncbi:hypothetical protein JCM39194_06620 [Desulfotomaculum varum]